MLQSLRNTMMTAANVTDACESRDPCQHGGICISTDNGPICECRSGDYEGIYCEKGIRTINNACSAFSAGVLILRRASSKSTDANDYLDNCSSKTTEIKKGETKIRPIK